MRTCKPNEWGNDVRVVSQTQVVQCDEVSHVSTNDPKQAENADAVEGGVAFPRDGRGGAEDPLGGGLKGEDVEAVGQKVSRKAPRTLFGALCERCLIRNHLGN